MMKNWKILMIFIFFLLMLVILLYSFFVSRNRLNVGYYGEPTDKFFNQTMDYHLTYYSWFDDQILADYLFINQNNEQVKIITLEPWPSKKDKNILGSVVMGKYDEQINKICLLFKDQNNVIVRWGHEMDLTGSRYPWAGKNAVKYIAAYQYFVDACRQSSENNNLKFIWSPSGDELAKTYWPGHDYVDLIGVSVYSYDLWDKKEFGKERTFWQIFFPKYYNLIVFNQPILIAEMGVTGNGAYQKKWLNKAIWQMRFLPRIPGFIYFNSQDVEGVWGQDLPTPDWRLP